MATQHQENVIRQLKDEIGRMKAFGLTPKDALIFWATKGYVTPYWDPALLPSDLKAYTPQRNDVTIKDSRGNWDFWNKIDPTGYLGKDKKYNASKYFIGKYNQKLEQMASRVALHPKSIVDEHSGFYIRRVGDEIPKKMAEQIALTNVVLSGDVNAITAALLNYSSVKDLRSAAISMDFPGVIKAAQKIAKDPILKPIGSLIVEKVPKDKIEAIATGIVGDFIQKNNIDVAKLIKNPQGYLQELAVGKGLDFAKGLISGSGKGGDGGGFWSSLNPFSGYNPSLSGVASVSHKLTPDEEKVANRIYENVFKIFKPIWEKRNDPSFWQLFEAAYIDAEEVKDQIPPADRVLSTGYASKSLGIQLPKDTNVIDKLVHAFAMASIMTSGDKFNPSVPLKKFLYINKAIKLKEADERKKSKQKDTNDAVPLSTDKAMKLFDPFGLMAKKTKRVPISQTPSASESIKQEVVDTYDEPVDEYVEPVQEDPAPVVDDTLVVMQDTKKDEEEKPSKVIPITLGVLALGGLAYLYFSNQSSSKKYYK